MFKTNQRQIVCASLELPYVLMSDECVSYFVRCSGATVELCSGKCHCANDQMLKCLDKRQKFKSKTVKMKTF